eukprot:5752085-Alexandrium_andersonii.AAC.1
MQHRQAYHPARRRTASRRQPNASGQTPGGHWHVEDARSQRNSCNCNSGIKPGSNFQCNPGIKPGSISTTTTILGG